MGNFLKKLADPLDLFDGGGGGVLSSLMDPLGLFGGGKGGGFKNALSGAVSQLVPQPQQAPAESLMTPTVMPTAEGDAQRAARRRSQVEQSKRRGRQSTILTGNDDSLGVTG